MLIQRRSYDLSLIREYLTAEKAKLLGNVIDSQFNYAPLIWMFCQKAELFASQMSLFVICDNALAIPKFIATLAAFIDGNLH